MIKSFGLGGYWGDVLGTMWGDAGYYVGEVLGTMWGDVPGTMWGDVLGTMWRCWVPCGEGAGYHGWGER